VGKRRILLQWGVGLKRCKEAIPFWVGGYGTKNNTLKGGGVVKYRPEFSENL
jgi:hypothetical protein